MFVKPLISLGLLALHQLYVGVVVAAPQDNQRRAVTSTTTTSTSRNVLTPGPTPTTSSKTSSSRSSTPSTTTTTTTTTTTASSVCTQGSFTATDGAVYQIWCGLSYFGANSSGGNSRYLSTVSNLPNAAACAQECESYAGSPGCVAADYNEASKDCLLLSQADNGYTTGAGGDAVTKVSGPTTAML